MWLPLPGPLRFLARLVFRPLQLLSRRKLLKSAGWLELRLEGPVHELWTPPRLPPIVRRWLGREEGPQVVLGAVRRLVAHVARDTGVQGVVIRIGHLGGGWAVAAELASMIDRLTESGKKVLVHLKTNAGNREYLIAAAGTRILAPPAVTVAAVGAAASTLFMKDTLDKAGVRVETTRKGRYKSATEAFTRSSRSEHDLEQTKALVDAIDEAMLSRIARGRSLERGAAQRLIDDAPLTGAHAVEKGLIDGLARDEELPEHARALTSQDEPPKPLRAGAYLAAREMPPLIQARKKMVGVVEVHGAIIDRAPSYPVPGGEKVAIERAVVNDLRAALEDERIGAVVLHVNSRGGSVTASDAIYSMVKRVERDKPVIACFSDISASGGYYVACGARAIVASPLTITGSIGVFLALPTWPELAERLALHHDVVKNRTNAGLYDPWRERTDAEREHADREVGAMYSAFIELVADARRMTKAAVEEVAEGRVWIAEAAKERGLLDGLGGMSEAVQRAKDAARGKFVEQPVLVRARGHDLPRPPPPERKAALIEALARSAPGGAVLEEMMLLALTAPDALAWAYAPIEVR